MYNNNFLIWYYKGVFLFKKHNSQEALQYLDKAIDLKPDDVLSWHMKSICLVILNQLDDAIKCNKKALSLNPGNKEIIRISKILEERKNA